MTPSPLKNLAIVHHFAALPDPRVQRTRRHSLNDIIVIAICGFVCGCKSWEQVAVYGRQHAAWFGTFLELPNGMPSKDTFRRVFARLKPAAFELANPAGGRRASLVLSLVCAAVLALAGLVFSIYTALLFGSLAYCSWQLLQLSTGQPALGPNMK